MNFKTLRHLRADLATWLPHLPRVDLIVGIPRSGMIPAAILAEFLQCRLTSLDHFAECRSVYVGGARAPKARPEKVLVLDDSSGKGHVMRRTRERLAHFARLDRIELLYGAVYVTEESAPSVDVYKERIEFPRVFEWNLFHHPRQMLDTWLDFDGVLCQDPTPEENDDGERYQAFLKNARPLFVPSVPIRGIVTSRLERYRAQTEDWLARHRVKFGRLVMAPFETKEERRAAKQYAEAKAEIYKSDGSLFVESYPKHARKIAALTGKPVFCTDTGELYR